MELWLQEEAAAQFEDAILSLGSAMSALLFREAVTAGLHTALDNVRQSLVLLLDLESGELAYYKSDTEIVLLPKSGIVWNAVRNRTREISQVGFPEDDPICDLLPNVSTLDKDQIVVLCPVVEKKRHQVIAFLMAVCDEMTVAHHEKLQWLEKNVLVSATRVLKHVAAEKERSRAEDMLRVCGDLSDLDTTSLSVKILKHLKSVVEAERCALFVLDDATNELVCQALDENPLDREIRKPIRESIYGLCFRTGVVLNIAKVSQDVRFNPKQDDLNGYEPSSMLCMPMKIATEKGKEPKPIGVVAVCNKKANHQAFSSRDIDNMGFVIRFSASVVANTLAYQRECILKKQNESLLQVARTLFSSLDNLDVLLHGIMEEARQLTGAEKCSLFLLDSNKQELIAVVFDSNLPSEKEVLRIAVGQGIAGYVAKTGLVVNIRDAYKHPKFFKRVDEDTGFHTRNILCFPINNSGGEVVGVAQLCNKIGGSFFNKYDQELAVTFSMYCGISIYHSKLYDEMKSSQGRRDLATELMLYHMKIPSDDLEKLVSTEIVPCRTYDEHIAELTYSPRNILGLDTAKAVMSMADEMGLIRKWHIPKDTLARFVLMVKRGYRNTPYHNWVHSLCVAHFCYTLHQNCKDLSVLSDLEIFTVFVSCLCHDIDHRGTNNAFQISSNSVLASLYSSEGSVMERHHFSQTLCILNSKGCNIFEALSATEYKEALDLIQANILATDIAQHLRDMKAITEMATVGFDPSDPRHHHLLCSLIMTSCDLSAT